LITDSEWLAMLDIYRADEKPARKSGNRPRAALDTGDKSPYIV
jgi:hypothetical protein